MLSLKQNINPAVMNILKAWPPLWIGKRLTFGPAHHQAAFAAVNQNTAH